VGQETVLADRYRLVSPLGRGGMGQVWEGRDERLDRPVAVKLLTQESLATRDDGVRRFTREAVVTAGLSHPGVPAIYDAGEYDGGLFLVMELVTGVTVGDLIAEQAPLPVPWVAAIGAQVAAVLAAAHARGVVHRDIKPSNVMVTGDGTAKILDFGLAGILSERLTSTGVSVGTPAYMAPEQLNDQPVTAAADLYALGCLLYEMLAGQPVFQATSPAALVRMHLDQAPAPLTRTDIDVPLTQLVWQLLAKEPGWRPSGAREVYDRLLPYVRPAGALGDIDPAAPDASGMRLYSRLLVRLAEPGPPVPDTPARPGRPGRPVLPVFPVVTAASGPPRPRHALRHSLWVAPTVMPFGMTTWLAFGYIAVRHGHRRWLAYAAAYLALMITGFVLVSGTPSSGSMPASATAGLVLIIAIWPVGFAHAVWVNTHERLPLIAAGNPRDSWRKR